MAHWLLKSEPSVYSFDDLIKEKQTCWSGVRNYGARIFLKEMKKGDEVFFYHSNEGMEIVGIAKIAKEAYPDPTINDDRWVAVDIKPIKKFKSPVSLITIKNDKRLLEMILVRNSRLSCQPVTDKEWETVLTLAGEK